MGLAAAAADQGSRTIVGKKQLCAILRWSRPTLDRRIDQDPNFPIHQRGDQRGGWEFDVEAVTAYLEPSAAQASGPAAPDAEPELPPTAPAPAVRLVHQGEETARQQRDSVQAELLRDKLRRQRGELIETAGLKLALSEAVTKLGTSLNALPDILVRRLNLPETAAPVLRQEIEEARRAFYAQLRDLLTDE